MGDFLHGQCSKGAGRTQDTIDSKFSVLHPTFKALSLTDTGVIVSYMVVLKVLILGFIIRLLRNNKIKQLLGDSFSQLVKLRRL